MQQETTILAGDVGGTKVHLALYGDAGLVSSCGGVERVIRSMDDQSTLL